MMIGCKSGPCAACYCHTNGCIAGRDEDFYHRASIDELKRRLDDPNEYLNDEEKNFIKKEIRNAQDL